MASHDARCSRLLSRLGTGWRRFARLSSRALLCLQGRHHIMLLCVKVAYGCVQCAPLEDCSRFTQAFLRMGHSQERKKTSPLHLYHHPMLLP